MREYWARFRYCFRTRTRDTSEYAYVYLRGQLTMEDTRNYANIERRLTGGDGQGLQQFMTDSPWSGQQVFRQILEVDPAPPRRLNPGISRDLNTVIMAAMEKEADRRYPTMTDFAKDLRRLQEGEVILAKPAGIGTKIGKRVKRNPWLSASILIIAVLILVFPWMIVKKQLNAIQSRLRLIEEMLLF